MFTPAARFLALFRKRSIERELAAEIEAHLAMAEDQYRARGMTAAEARAAARRDFGGVEQAKEAWRDRRGLPSLEGFAKDVMHALRGLKRNPGFAGAAVLSLGLGIGANSAVFSLFNALMLRMLPVRDPARLISIYQSGGWSRGFASYPLFLELRERKDLFEGVIARSGVGKVRFGSGGLVPEFAGREYVSGNYFELLGIQPAFGRLLTPADNRVLRGHPVAVLSYDFWRSRMGADLGIVGRALEVDEEMLTVVGVAQPGFRGVEPARPADLWVPAVMHRGKIMNPGSHWAWLLARPGAGVSGSRLQAALDLHMRNHLEAAYGKSRDAAWRRRVMRQRLEVRPGGIGISLLRDQFEKPLRILLGVVGLVMLVACANVAGLVLARGAARRREIALRYSLGAGRGRILRQMLAESALIAAAGMAAGLLFAFWAAPALLWFVPRATDALHESVRPDTTVLAFTGCLGVLAVLVAGLIPALRSTAADPGPALKLGAGWGGVPRQRLRKALVASQVALSVVLVAGAGLFARTLAGLRAIDPGFHNLNVVAFWIDYPRAYRNTDVSAARERYMARIASLPGVLSASFSFPGPFASGDWSGSFRIPGQTGREEWYCDLHSGGPRYFETIGASLLNGREFTAADKAGAARVAIVNQAFARRYFNGADPVGRVLSVEKGDAPTTIVGLAPDMRHADLRQPATPTIYLSALQASAHMPPMLLVRAHLPAATLMPALRRELSAVDPALGMIDPRSLRGALDDSIYLERMLAALSGFFGILALLLAATGIYGVIAYAVTRRTPEIGVRMALGARSWSVLWMVLREALLLVLAGVALGLPAALVSTRLAATLLYGIKPGDAATLALTAAVLLAAGIAAAVLPARRALSIDPAQTLRQE